ncbi:hypothetical protein [aff. Roholtiella sp. LEGE 12411]|uniref:hypothetical protein n=1 Tax=aff. Roholtiella sp. LEGE 12411 TaxID=1828822 RepID=UPI0018818448|nr:hypothetical protein [aff. Roholtiella sp. LEGE 12411]MBE9034845.1 hypothetical protein [aff. Roholtiella sp. LEGE 12411]
MYVLPTRRSLWEIDQDGKVRINFSVSVRFGYLFLFNCELKGFQSVANIYHLY